MADQDIYEARRESLRQRYLSDEAGETRPVGTGGVDHLALISSNLDATIEFYTEVLHMRLTSIVTNRDDTTSTHIFFDMGGGNQLAFFDFPEHGPAPTVRGIGSMHHVALKAEPAAYQALLDRLQDRGINHSTYGTPAGGSVFIRDPDNILVEVTTSG